MIYEENKRKVKGATAHDSMVEQNQAWPERMNSLDFNLCSDEFKKFIENTDLDELVYWKLKEKLDKQSSSKQSEILKGVIADVERPLFAIILSKTNGNQSKAAELLGCNRNTLHRKLKEFLIDPRDIKKTIRSKSLKKDYYPKIKSPQTNSNFKNVSLNEVIEV